MSLRDPLAAPYRPFADFINGRAPPRCSACGRALVLEVSRGSQGLDHSYPPFLVITVPFDECQCCRRRVCADCCPDPAGHCGGQLFVDGVPCYPE